MRLSKLTLCGFKSFADRAEFTFDESMTGVVGPNGCGKSNIVDAIKWVLGERSSKSLRGKEMADVIFAGSAGRKPSGLASVSLCFENPVVGERSGADAATGEPASPGVDEPAGEEGLSEVEFDRTSARRRGLPIDADVVEVERRLYRDGTSQYLINGRRARLRDIRDLFLDTGIGADAYSIIEQGKVDAMLLANPQERRVIFEEAAGVAKYKQRRIESQRKLEKTEQNLSLTREQLGNTERRLRLVKGQAAKAKRFIELDGEHRSWRLALAFEQYDELRVRLDGLTSRRAELSEVRERARVEVEGLEARRQDADLARHELHGSLRGAQQDVLAARHGAEAARQRQALTRRAIEEASRQLEIDRATADELRARVERAVADRAEQDALVASLTEQLASADAVASAARDERARALEAAQDSARRLAEHRRAAGEIDLERASLAASIEADARRAEAIREQSAQVVAKLAQARAEEARVERELAEAHAGLEACRGRIADAERRAAELDAAFDARAADRRSAADAAGEVEQRALRLDERRATLREMVDSRVGLGDAAKRVLESREQGGFSGVLGALSEAIEVDADLAAAVEAALGRDVQALVVESVAGMPSGQDLAALPGRVTFLPLAGVPETGRAAIDPGWMDSMGASGRVVRLRGAVRIRVADPSGAWSALLDRLLGSALLVQGIDEALLLRAGPAPGARFVTRDGVVLDADGRVLAGPAGPQDHDGAGLLQRRTELAALDAQADEASRELAERRAVLEALDAEAAALSGRRSEARTLLWNEQRALVADQSRVDRLDAERARLVRDAGGLDDETRALAHRLERASAERARAIEKAQSLGRLLAEQQGLASEQEALVESSRREVDEAGEALTRHRVESGRLGEQLASASREARRLSGEAEDAERQHEHATRRVEHGRSRIEEDERSSSEAGEDDARLTREEQEHATRAEALAGRADEADRAAREIAEAVVAARQRGTIIDRDWQALELTHRELEVRRESMEERASAELGIDLGFEYADYREMMRDGAVSRIDVGEGSAEAERLREEIRRLGSVNLDAIEEESQLESRNEELIRQVADLDQARATLSALIEKLDHACRTRFTETFARVQEHFAGADGMFRRLFGGGRAEIKLMPVVEEVDGRRVESDRVDPLESGIEIIAKPPGKEPRSISQLSGGEKTLTAVALLLAIFQSKPSCFCVLDEVDAALDDANVGRYCAVVRQFTTHSRFIVITHNKKTMQACDRLYGITMQERGVSTRVSVRFEQVGANGAITPEPEASSQAKPARGTSPARGKLAAALASMRDDAAEIPAS